MVRFFLVRDFSMVDGAESGFSDGRVKAIPEDY